MTTRSAERRAERTDGRREELWSREKRWKLFHHDMMPLYVLEVLQVLSSCCSSISSHVVENLFNLEKIANMLIDPTTTTKTRRPIHTTQAPPQDDQWVSKRAPLLPYQHLVVTTRCIDESWCIDYKNTIPHIKAMCRLLKSSSSSSIAHDESPCSFQRLFTSPPIQGGMSEQLCFSGGEALYW